VTSVTVREQQSCAIRVENVSDVSALSGSSLF